MHGQNHIKFTLVFVNTGAEKSWKNNSLCKNIHQYGLLAPSVTGLLCALYSKIPQSFLHNIQYTAHTLFTEHILT